MKVAVCGIAGEGTREGNQMVLAASEALKKRKVLVYLSYVAGDDGELSGRLRKNSEYFDVKTARELNLNVLNKGGRVSNAMMSGLRRCISHALANGAEAVIYTELDKPEFCRDDLDSIIQPLFSGNADITIAQRSDAGWKKFPLAQRLIEGISNRELTRSAGMENHGTVDFLYGPKGFTLNTVGLFNTRTENDWATITYPVVAGARAGYRVLPVTVPGFPQEGYLDKYPFPGNNIAGIPGTNFPGQLLWRVLQCKPNFAAVRHAEEMYP